MGLIPLVVAVEAADGRPRTVEGDGATMRLRRGKNTELVRRRRGQAGRGGWAVMGRRSSVGMRRRRLRVGHRRRRGGVGRGDRGMRRGRLVLELVVA